MLKFNQSKMSTRITGFAKWKKQMVRKVEKWMNFDPEWKTYMPVPTATYLTNKTGLPASIPTETFISEFKIKYYQQDLRDKINKNHFVIYRDDIVNKPIRIREGQTVGPFHGATHTTLLFHEDEDKQVYTYEKERVFQPTADYVDIDEKRRREEKPREYIWPVEQLTKLPEENRSNA
jgi:hypothetical protein